MAVVAMVVMCFLPALAPVLGPILSGALTAAVGSAITQGIGIALGIQEKFDWKQVGMAALSAGVTKGMVRLGDSVPAVASFFEKIGSAGQAIVGNVVTQGIAVATKLQPSFSWRSVAAAAVSAEIGKVDTGITEALAGHVGERLASLTDKFVSNVGTSLAQAAFGGKVDLAAIVVDAFGNAVGNSIVDTLKNFENSKVPDRPAREIKAIGKDEIMKMPDTVLADLNASMGMPNIGSTYIAQRGDSISKIVGTSDPAAIGAFMRANGLTSSEIFAGQEYELPTDSYTRADARLGQSALNADNARLAEAREISAQIDGWVHEGIDAITPNALDRAASQAFDQLFVNAMHQYAAEEEYRNNPYAGRSGVSLYYQALGMTPGAPDILGAVAALDDFTRSPTVVRIGGAARAIGGVSEMSFGAAFEGAPIAGQIFGTAVIWHGADQTQAGLKELIYGEPTDTFSIRGMINAGMDASWARGIDGTASILLGGVAPLARSAGLLDDIFYPSQYVARQTLGELPSTLTFGADSRALSEWSEAAKLGTYRDLNLTIWERGLLAQERELAEAANWTRPNGKTWWPPYDGAIPGTQRVVTLKPGVEPVSGWVDRYGSTAGRFISPDGLPWSSRALPGTQSGVPNLYEIKGAVPGAMKGVISPWFGQRGLGTQYELVFDVQTYLKAQRFE
jgi:hypothetical protein